MGKLVCGIDRRPRYGVVDDRRDPYKGASACGRRGRGKRGHVAYKRGLNTKVHLAVDATGMPLRVIITEGTTGDCTEALPLIEGFQADALMADKAYDTDGILNYAHENGIDPVIPPKKNRKEKRDYDTYLYRLRHLVENAILDLKGWRGVATRYAKRASSFLAIVQIRCAFLWAHIS